MTAIHPWYVNLDMSVFAERLRYLRTLRKISQTRLAELLEVSPRVYNRWEKGGNIPHFDTIVKIADILQVSLDELASRQEAITEPKIRNPELHQLCQQADALPDEEQKALILVMDSLVKKSQMSKVLGRDKRGPSAPKKKAG